MAPLIEGAARRHVEVETADAGRLRLHVAELGEGPPVLMLHGWPQHAGMWRKVAPLLAPHHRLICPDLRGFGASDAPGRGYDRATFAADALALLDALELDRVFLMGHDWGGAAGFIACFDAPARIRAYVALNTPLPWIQPSPRVLAEMWRSWYAVVLASPLGPRIVRDRPDLIVRTLRGGLVHRDAISAEEARGYAESLARPPSARATQALYRSYLRAAATAVRGPRPPRLTVPALLLFGARDQAVSKELIKGHERHADDLRVELVEDASHFVAEERPDLVARRALELFEGVRADG